MGNYFDTTPVIKASKCCTTPVIKAIKDCCCKKSKRYIQVVHPPLAFTKVELPNELGDFIEVYMPKNLHIVKGGNNAFEMDGIKLNKDTFLDIFTNKKNLEMGNLYFEKTIFGLPNMGNTCYMNSALNALIRHPFKDLDTIVLNTEPSSRSEDFVMFDYLNLIKLTYADKDNHKVIESHITNIKEKIAIQNERFLNFNQEDSSEFYHSLVTVLMTEYKQLANIKIEKKSFNNQIFEKESTEYKNHIKEYLQHNFQTEDVFNGLYCGSFLIELSCNNCKYLNISFENFIQISIQTYNNNQEDESINLINLLENYFDSTLENNIKCKNCKRNEISNITRKIIRFPHIFSIALDRNNDITNRKDKRKVNKIGRLNLDKFIYSNPNNVEYELYATLNHYGSLRGGHYIAYLFKYVINV